MFSTRTRPLRVTRAVRRRAVMSGLVVAAAAGVSLVTAPTAEAAGPAPAPGQASSHPPAATVAISDAYHQALTGGETPAEALAAVEDGPSLAGALAQAMANFPSATATAQVSTSDITLTDPHTATLRFHVTYTGGLDFGTQVGGAVKVQGRWKVSRDTYCMVLGWAGATCPPRAGRPPAHPEAAKAAIAAAFHQAFTGGETPAEALAAVEDGPSLADALAQAMANFPTATATAQVTTGDVVFSDPRHASVPFHLVYQDGIDFGTVTGTALVVDGTWKVSRDTYCMVLGWAGATCPPRA